MMRLFIALLLIFSFEQAGAKSSVQKNLLEHSCELFVDEPVTDSNENLEKIHHNASAVQNISTLKQSYSYLFLKISNEKIEIQKPPDIYLLS